MNHSIQLEQQRQLQTLSAIAFFQPTATRIWLKPAFSPAANGMQIAFYALSKARTLWTRATQMVDDGTQKWRRERQQQPPLSLEGVRACRR